MALTAAVLMLATEILIQYLRSSNLDWGVFSDINKESGVLVILQEAFLVAGIAFKLTFNSNKFITQNLNVFFSIS